MVAGMPISFCNYFDATLINDAPYDSTGNDHIGGSCAGVLPVPEESDGSPQNSTQNSSTQRKSYIYPYKVYSSLGLQSFISQFSVAEGIC